MQVLPPALLPLGSWPQFVCWFAVPHPDKPGKFNKLPCHWQTGEVIDAHVPGNWTTADVALAMAPQWDRGHGSGAGFVFTAADPFFFQDIDKCWTGDDWSALAKDLCARLGGCAVEVSHSGTGLHIIGMAASMAHRSKNTALGLELYTSGRFVALTGTHATGDASYDATVALAGVIAEFFDPTAVGEWGEGWTSEPMPEWTGPADDDELIRKALAAGQRSAAAVFGGPVTTPTFADLWEANVDILAAWKPGEGMKPFGQSEADQALANALAFWTGKDCDRMARLMRQSALARDKWDVHRTYLADTILGACAFVQKVYTHVDAPAGAPLSPVLPTAVMQAGADASGRPLRDPAKEYMGPFEQLQHFAGCYYDYTTGEIYNLEKNRLFDKQRFDVQFGGHIFILDPQNSKRTESAWEAFTKSRVYKPAAVDALAFRPELPPGAFIEDGAQVYVNSYVPHHARRVAGDPSKLLDHVARLFPLESDRITLLSYFASMAQNPGRKFQWWPVIQGAEGNGKTIFINIMTHVMGHRYTHLPNPHKMARNGSNFNEWIYRKLFIGVEEINVSHRRDFLEEFKAVVTNERIEVEGKGANQFMGDNRVNGCICTNHKDGVPITTDGRRYSIFYCAQQSADDIERDGMTAAYFADLHDWLRGRGAYEAMGADYGLAVMAEYLHTYPLEAIHDPARLSTRAPRTSSTDEALRMSLGAAEQEILNAIEEDRPGFAGGWVSSKYLDLLLEQMGIRVPRPKRRALMNALGYDWHPSLREGRTNDVVAPDMTKPRLYVKRDHLVALNVREPAEIGRLYSNAQNPASSAEAVFKAPVDGRKAPH